MSVGFAGHPRGSREYRRLLIALAFAGVATFTQLYSSQGILPLIGRDLGIDAATAALTVSGTTAGLAVAVIPWSLLADRIGRLPAMRIAIISATVLGLLAPLMPDAATLIGVRVVEGLALGGLPAIALTYLAEEVDRRHAVTATATYVAGTSVGGLLGRLIAAPIAEQAGWRVGMGSVAVIAAVAAVVFIALAPRSSGFAFIAGHPLRRLVQVIGMLARDRVMLALWAQGFLLMGGFVTVYNYLAFHLEGEPFLLPPSLASLLFTAYLAGTASSRFAGGLAERVGTRQVLLVASGVMLAGLSLTLVASLPVVVIGLIVLTAGFFAGHAAASAAIGQRAARGRAQAASVYTLGYYAGSSLFGWLGGLALLAGDWSAVVALVAVLVTLAGVTALAVGPGGRAGGGERPARH